MANLCWESCPIEMLWQIFMNLEDETLFICLQVSQQWKTAAYNMLTKKYGGLEQAVKNVIQSIGNLYKNKTHLNLKDSYLNSLLWYNVSNATIKCFGSCGKKVRYLSTYKDCLIIVDEGGVLYYDMEKKIFREYLNVYCLTFDEGDNMVAMTRNHGSESTMLTVCCKEDNQIVINNEVGYNSSVITYRFYDDCCYFVNHLGFIVYITMDENCKNVVATPIGRYYGCANLIISMHVVNDRTTFIMLKTGIVLNCSTTHPGQLHNCDALCLNSPYRINIDTNPRGFMFDFGSVSNAPIHQNFTVNYYDNSKFLTITCPGLICACDHGNVLILGYDNGKINIFVKRKLVKGNCIPERTIDVYNFYNGPFHSTYRDIHQIKVYEAMGSHFLCIMTDSVLVMLLVENLELISSDAQIENVDELCLSIIHMLNIEL